MIRIEKLDISAFSVQSSIANIFLWSGAFIVFQTFYLSSN